MNTKEEETNQPRTNLAMDPNEFPKKEWAAVHKWLISNRGGNVEQLSKQELFPKGEKLALLFHRFLEEQQWSNTGERGNEGRASSYDEPHHMFQSVRKRGGQRVKERGEEDSIPGKAESGEIEYGGRSKRNRTVVVVVLIALVLMIIALVCLYYYKQHSGTQESLREFKNSFPQVEVDFPGQTPRFWRILRNRATAHLKNPHPKKPLVIMLTAGPSAYNVLECIARKLAQTLEPDHNGLGHINSVDYNKYSSPDDAKKSLDETLKQLLQKGRAVIVSNVDQLPVQSPLLFYEYCDNENAPFKQAAIIFTVRLRKEPDPALEPAKAESLVPRYLKETWGKQDYTRPDDIPPLVSRITDTVVMVKEESDQTVKIHCGT